MNKRLNKTYDAFLIRISGIQITNPSFVFRQSL